MASAASFAVLGALDVTNTGARLLSRAIWVCHRVFHNGPGRGDHRNGNTAAAWQQQAQADTLRRSWLEGKAAQQPEWSDLGGITIPPGL